MPHGDAARQSGRHRFGRFVQRNGTLEDNRRVTSRMISVNCCRQPARKLQRPLLWNHPKWIPCRSAAVLGLYPERYEPLTMSCRPTGRGSARRSCGKFDRSGIVLPARLAAGSRPCGRVPRAPSAVEASAREPRRIRFRSDSREGRATLVASDGRWWQLEPWLPGRADFHAFPSEARLAAAMCGLANCIAGLPPRSSRRRRSGHG